MYETDISKHPDVDPEFAAKAAEIVKRRKAARAALSDPKAQKAIRFYKDSVIKKEEFEPDWEYYIDEAHMTAAYKKKEERLKNKYDDSGMKASMIKQYGPEKGKQVYFAYIRKQAMKEALEVEILDEAKRSRGERRTANAGKKGYDKHGRPVPKGAVHAFDVDETIVSHGKGGRPNVKVHVNDPQGNRVKSLTNQEFNTYKLEPGHSYDFSEFRSSKKFGETAAPNKKVIAKIKKLQRRNKNVQLITARAKFDNPEEFKGYFERHGIKLKPGNIHYTGGMRGSDIGQKKVDVAKGITKMTGSRSIHMYDDAAKVHKAFEAEKEESPRLKIKTHLAKPNKKGEVMTRSYQATKSEEFELWVNALIDEGYDLSNFTVDELIEAYQEILDEAITAVAAPGENDKDKPIKKGPRPLNYKSPYKKYSKDKYVKEEVKETTPYEYWKSFIGEKEQVEEEVIEESVEVIEKPLTSYDYWKAKVEEQAGSEDRGERHVAHDVAMKKRDPN